MFRETIVILFRINSDKDNMSSVVHIQISGHFDADSLVCMYTRYVHACPTLCNPWTAAHQAPLSMKFSREEY